MKENFFEAVVLSGGLGTRLRGVVSDRPKSLALIGEVPFLQYLLEFLRRSNVPRAILSVGYKKEMIERVYGNRYQDLLLHYCEEDTGLGTGGAIQKSLPSCRADRVFILNGDSLFLISLLELSRFHGEKKANVTIAVRRVFDTGRFGRVEIGEGQRICRFEEKGVEKGSGFMNGGIYCVERSFLELFLERFQPPFSMETDVFPRLVKDEGGVFAYPSDEYFVDIGTPESLQLARETLPTRFPIPVLPEAGGK